MWQASAGRHAHLEHPCGSVALQTYPLQKIREKLLWSGQGFYRGVFHQCCYGLRCPNTGRYFKKATEVWSTLEDMVTGLCHEGRCQGGHAHTPLQGTIYDPKTKKRIAATAWSENYPKELAKKITDIMMRDVVQHYAMAADEAAGPEAARARAGVNVQRRQISCKEAVQKLHNNLGHPTTRALVRLLEEGRARKEIIDAAKEYVCPSCARHPGPGTRRPAAMPASREFNQVLGLDCFKFKQWWVLSMIDEATTYHLATVIPSHHSKTLLKALRDTWFKWASRPQRIRVDAERGLISDEFQAALEADGVILLQVAAEAPWKHGREERHDRCLEEMIAKCDKDEEIQTMEQLEVMIDNCIHAKNSISVHRGYSPRQWVLAVNPSLP